MKKFNPEILQPGDILLFAPSSFFGYAISWLTAGRVSHVEIYKGGGISYASRDGIGVDEYPLRVSGLYQVLRSRPRLNMGAMAIEFKKHKGHAYDYGTIVKFICFGRVPKWVGMMGTTARVLSFGKVGWKSHAEVCSEIGAFLLRASGLSNIFGSVREDEVSPRDYQKQPDLYRIYPAQRLT